MIKMNSCTRRHKSKADKMLVSITKTTGIRMTKTRTDPKETFEIKMKKPTATFFFSKIH